MAQKVSSFSFHKESEAYWPLLPTHIDQTAQSILLERDGTVGVGRGWEQTRETRKHDCPASDGEFRAMSPVCEFHWKADKPVFMRWGVTLGVCEQPRCLSPALQLLTAQQVWSGAQERALTLGLGVRWALMW